MADEEVKDQNEQTVLDGSDRFLIQNGVTDETEFATADTLNDFIVDNNWWEEIARTTLGAPADVITVSSIPARKYIKIIAIGVATGGTLDTNIIFNNDTGSNYAYRQNNNDTISSVTSANNITIEAGATDSGQLNYFTLEMINILANEKSGFTTGVSQDAAGGATVPVFIVNYFKWANVLAQMSRIDWTNVGTGDFAIGSSIVVLGHD